jgi:hypothetical protein
MNNVLAMGRSQLLLALIVIAFETLSLFRFKILQIHLIKAIYPEFIKDLAVPNIGL